MKVRRGFLLTYDKALRKMIPFFVKVRSRDIIADNPIEISSVLKPTSGLWNLDRVEDTVNATTYKYTAQWTSRENPQSERVGTDFGDCELIYTLYKDGRMDINGTLRVSRSSRQTIDSVDFSEHRYDIYLPFAFPESKPEIHVSWKFGLFPECGMSNRVISTEISNLIMNPNLADKTKYPFLLNVYLYMDTEGAGVPMSSFVAQWDPKFTGSNLNSYHSESFPIAISYSGWWKPIPEVEIENAKEYDGTIAGAYKTKGSVPLLSMPDATDGVIIRPLPGKTLVRNYGYYTTRDGVRWLLVVYPDTNERGYIQESALTRGA